MGEGDQFNKFFLANFFVNSCIKITTKRENCRSRISKGIAHLVLNISKQRNYFLYNEKKKKKNFRFYNCINVTLLPLVVEIHLLLVSQ